ncbi:hypothetical protein Cva_00759 [Caedimonas varicaedens]|uniref:Uncharacterized protein n=1 Tax=Caedimonas varicaedens TaxID=1629334 RepID=A0A0K8MC70_9PROT|nr:hypothetical protein Cva_00759 [Caedimonas varicaedens]
MFNEKPIDVNTREFEEKLLIWLKEAEVQDPHWQDIVKTHFEEGLWPSGVLYMESITIKK